MMAVYMYDMPRPLVLEAGVVWDVPPKANWCDAYIYGYFWAWWPTRMYR